MYNGISSNAIAMALSSSHTQAKYIQDRKRLILECKRIMEGIYTPDVACFMLELAQRRGRLEQLRGLVGMSFKVDDIRRLIMAETYYSPYMILQLTARDITKLVMPEFKQYSRFGIMWRNLWYYVRRSLNLT